MTQQCSWNLVIISVVLGCTVSTTAYAQKQPETTVQQFNPHQSSPQQPSLDLPAQGGNRQCQNPQGKLFAKTELFFGLSKPDGTEVSDRAFQNFVNTQVTPRFPNGLTLLAGVGQFRNSSGMIIREQSRLLILLYPFTKNSNEAIEAIRRNYRFQFQQESVLRVNETACVSFD
jgi:Protein of unknown function (DUF3574)